MTSLPTGRIPLKTRITHLHCMLPADIRRDILRNMSRETKVFKSGNSLAVRLLGPCRLPRGTRVREIREGDRIIIEAIEDEWPPEFLAAAGAFNDEIPRPADNDDLRDPFA